ncbi:serine hydrolase [Ferruginibacter sp. HRS2-29]|uniref:serine hydrolase n=1 Tax=Ferruginibacter sp. HRS2-29 TaxID=2487334 RepID=UPI0020CDBA7C|nr:serine hydrolase [Ferruginibacter sp. HRS2-29]MCP9749410.1 D-alanyl-D-alanine carboxypeptidase [Ferruginibacter sp. HRS2-29]
MKKVFYFFLLLLSQQAFSQSTADSLLNFIAANKSRSSIYLSQNDTVLAHVNENTLMPLASTVKIMVAVEFAKQAALNVIDQSSKVSLAELEKYYLPNTDGDAHPNWIAYEKKMGHIQGDSARLMDVARGMIMFSSNANTEYLMDLLGFDNVKNNIQLFGLKQHTAIYPIVASLFMYQNPKGKKEESILKGIKKLSDQEYSRYIFDMHNALKYSTLLKDKFRPQDLTMTMQKAWSDRLPASTTKEYVRICKVLNNRKFFDENTYGIISEVLETIMENPANQKWLKHAGMKGGSTAWVLTKAVYATTKEDTKLEMAYFFNNLTEDENQRLQKWMNSFELKVMSDAGFRKKITETLK